MIANKVEVISRKYNEEKKIINGHRNGAESLILKRVKEKSWNTNYFAPKDEATKLDFTDRFHIKHVVETYSNHINFKVEFIPENLEAGAKLKF